jgi:hypothetical protein
MVAAPLESIVAKHNAVVSSHGVVWFGVGGAMPSSARCAFLLDQIHAGIPAHLYVVQRGEQGLSAFCAPMLSISSTPPTSNHLIPPYYLQTNFTTIARFWVTIQEFKQIDSRTLKSFHVLSTGTPLMEVLTRGMSSLMIIC